MIIYKNIDNFIGFIMKTVILAGGRGTRISEEGSLTPKAMVYVGGIQFFKYIEVFFTLWA